MDLASDETVIYQGHPSWRSILGFYIKGALLAVGAGIVAAVASRIAEDDVKSGWVIAAVLGLLGVVLVVGWIKRTATTYTISTKHLRIKRGIVARRNEEARLDRVQNVNTTQSALERLLRVGTVDFDTAGTGDSDFRFAGVADPAEIVQAIRRAQEEAAAGTGPPRS